MHSRIIELSKDPILKNERMCESSVPDWFYHSIADYTDADTDRDHDIKWFLDAVARVVDVAEDGKSFTFKPKAKQKYFERQYHAFLDKACELTGISLDAFVGEAKYDIGMAMYKLNEHYQDMTRRSIRTTRSSRVCPSLSMTTETFGTTMPAISRSVRCRQASCPMASSPPPASAMAVMSATRTRVRMARSTSHSSFSLMSNCFLARECFGTPLAVSRRC